MFAVESTRLNKRNTTDLFPNWCDKMRQRYLRVKSSDGHPLVMPGVALWTELAAHDFIQVVSITVHSILQDLNNIFTKVSKELDHLRPEYWRLKWPISSVNFGEMALLRQNSLAIYNGIESVFIPIDSSWKALQNIFRVKLHTTDCLATNSSSTLSLWRCAGMRAHSVFSHLQLNASSDFFAVNRKVVEL